MGLDSNGTLKSAGHDAEGGQREVDDWTDIVAIATGLRHTVGLNSAGMCSLQGMAVLDNSIRCNQIRRIGVI